MKKGCIVLAMMFVLLLGCSKKEDEPKTIKVKITSYVTNGVPFVMDYHFCDDNDCENYSGSFTGTKIFTHEVDINKKNIAGGIMIYQQPTKTQGALCVFINDSLYYNGYREGTEFYMRFSIEL